MFLRSRWRVVVLSASAIIVVMLILSPSVTVSDLQARDINSLLSRLPYHMMVRIGVPPGTIGKALNAVSSLEGVNSTAYVAVYTYDSLGLSLDNVTQFVEALVLVGGDHTILDGVGFRIVAGRMPGPGEVALPSYHYNRSTLGTEVSLGVYGTHPFRKLGNYTVVGLYELVTGGEYLYIPVSGNALLMGSGDFIEKYGYADSSVLIYITVNPELINPYDMDVTKDNLYDLESRIKEAIYVVTGNYRIEFHDRLLMEIQNLKEAYFGRTLLLMAFAIPYLIVAWYYGIVAGESTLNGLKHYLGSMISRGVPISLAKRGYFEFVFLTSLTGAVLGVFLSVGVGHLVSWVLYDIRSSSFVGLLDSAIAAVLAVLTAVIIYWRTSKRIEEIRPVEALRIYEPGGEEVERASKLAWAAFILGSLKMAEWISGVAPQDLLRHVEGNSILTMLIIIWLILSSFLQVFAPFFFVYGAAKVLTAHRRSLKAISRFFTHLLGRGDAPLAHRYSSALPRTHSRTAFVAALLVSMMVLSLGLFGTIVDYTDRLSTFIRGSDVAYYWTNGNVTEVEEAVRSLDPDAYLLVAELGQGTVSIPACGFFDQYARIMGIVSGKADALFWGKEDKISLSGKDPSEVLDSLRAGQAVVVAWDDSESLKDCTGGKMNLSWSGEVVYYKSELTQPSASPHGNWEEYTISDVFRALPGTDNMWSWIVLIDDRGDTSVRSFYVYMKGVDPSAAEERLKPLGGSEKGDYSVVGILRGTADWLRIYGIYGSFLALLSVGILSFSVIRSRLYDIAVMRSRGFTPKRAAKMAYLIVLPGVAFGLVLGFATGLISLYGYKSVISVSDILSSALNEVVPLSMHFMLGDLLLIGGAVAAFLAVPFILSLEAAREELVKELRGV